ncbi:MAG: energy transducer TonB [Rhodospirillaceae bacterium]
MTRVRAFDNLTFLDFRSMNSLSARELLDTPQTSTGMAAEALAMRQMLRDGRGELRSSGQKVFGGLVAVSIQVLFLAGLAYGTMRELVPQLENITVVNILDETPVVEETPPPPPPKFEQPVIHMQAPLVTISEPEPPMTAPTAIISEAPTPAPVRTSDAERERIVGEFQRSLQRHLIRHMRYPPAARARKEEGIVYVRVAMDRHGYVRSARIQDASDFPQLNEEGIAVVTRAQPLPVPPDAVPGDPVDLIIPVTFSLRMSGRSGRGGDRGHRDN